MKRIARIVFVIFCVLYAGRISAQRYPFHNLNVDEGLIQSQATCMAQDKMGFLWIGTLGGLSRYDGNNFTNYTVRDGLINNMIFALAADSAGSVWIGSQSGLSKFNGKTFVQYNKPRSAVRVINNSQQIQIINDTAWWRSQGEVYFITKGKIKYVVTPGEEGFVSAMLAEKGGLWIAKGDAIYHKYNNNWDTVKFVVDSEQKAPKVTRILRDKDSQIWIATSGGLYKMEKAQLRLQILDSTEQALQILSMTQDKAGALWLGTNKGVIKVAGNTTQYYKKHNGLSDNSFLDMFTDVEGNVWMASDGQGIFRFSGTQFAGLDETMGLPSAQVMSIVSNKRDSLFLGTYDAGLFVFKAGKISPVPFPSNPTPDITSLCYSYNSTLWIGTRGRGLWSFAKGEFNQFNVLYDNFPSNNINTVYEDASHLLWIGFSDGAMVFDEDTFITVVPKNVPVFSFLTIGKDSTLIATEASANGLQLYHAGVLSDYVTNTRIDSSSVQCFIMRGDELWMGSSDNGVIRYNTTTHKALFINKSNGLKSDFIYNIVADNDGNIWVGTGYGIHKIKIGPNDEPQVTFYGKAQGITGMESNINSVLKLQDGSIWFGTTNGALHYQPHTAVVSSVPTCIVLQSVKLTGESTIDHKWYDSTDNWYGIPYHLHLPYQKNNISFTFQAITLSGAQQTLYRYHMDGLETPWSEWSGTNAVSYSVLPPGNYVFHVQCKGTDDKRGPELTYSFEIITPFQKTKWFRYTILIGCILSGILLQYIVNSRKQRRLRLLAKLRSEEQDKVRQRTAEDFHDEIGNKLTRINVLTSVLKNKITLTPDSIRILGQIEDNTAQLYSGTRDILWSLKPSNDNLYEILHRVRDFGAELFQDTEVNFTFSGTDEKWRKFRLPMDMSRNLIMIFKEALNNTLKYSGARNVSFEVNIKNRTVLQIVLKDDGQGFDVAGATKGNGINNMKLRAERLKGRIYVDSRKDKGTIINLTFKIPHPGPKG